ncbi:DNA methyltransferase [Haematospirillum sp. 15-248]|uniref:McrB family protein n=1 Tax=Haematospirillum sp. 15-248 TaxID=2723107 RepID=UPI0014395F50|nr:DNA methyltransferase [Haematospirillum sp. 15-248]NKD87773.1 DNA methyltransferase [Haematospirillum sp. 15-248]
MPKFLTAERLSAAIEALADTRGKAALLDFLIVKRTLALKGASQVAITQGEPTYIQATRELAAVEDSGHIEIGAEKAIFNVFASADTKAGFRSGKYISNGTGSTIGGNTWQAIIELSTDKPRKASFQTGYTSHLADLLLKDSPRLGKPNLAEVAVWNYRHVDIEPTLGTETDPARRGKLLEASFTADYGLTAAEIAELFDTSGATIGDENLGGSAASPASYLAGLTAAPASPAVTMAGLPCSLDLVVALAAKPFVIMTGTSGTGKSRATLRLAEQLQAHYGAAVDGQVFQLVAIGPDWTSPKKLLGYRTPFGAERTRSDGSKTNESYEITETLRIILRACNPKSTKIPHFLVFDEMNLSHVERYFAPFLSLMEAANILEDGANAPIVDRQSLAVIRELLDLEDKDSPEAESARLLVTNEQALTLPPNLFYVGTVNVDETTYMFSPKVLDRAHVLEVRALAPSQYVAGASPDAIIDLVHANNLLREAIDDRDAGEGRLGDPSAVLDTLVSRHGVDAGELAKCKALTLQVLDGCFHLLSPTGFEFAYRVVKEVHSYMLVWTKAQLAMGTAPIAVLATWVDGLDRALFQKVLPKVHGNRSALGDSLKALAAFLGGGDGQSTPAAKYSLGVDAVVQIEAGKGLTLPAGASFKLSMAKLLAMHDRLVTRNYVSFVR